MSYIPGIIERHEALFAIISMNKKYITPDDLMGAIIIQAKENAKKGEQQFYREIFLDHNTMSIEQIIEVCDIVFQMSARRV